MVGMCRSEKMSLCDVYLQPEIAFEVLSGLGEMGCVQFIDMHPELQLFQRNYVQEVCRCSEMERRLRYMEREMKANKIPIPSGKEKAKARSVNELVEFEAMIEKWNRDLKDMTKNEQQIMQSYLKLREMFYVLKYIGPILGKAEISTQKLEMQKRTGMSGMESQTGRLTIITGVIKRKRAFVFEMLLWRISRGMIYYREAPEDKKFTDPKTGNEMRKVAFLALCQGETLAARVKKICSGFRVNIYTCPNTYSERTEMIDSLSLRIIEMEQVLANTRYLRCKALWTISRQWEPWMTQVCKSKAIYYEMNKFTLDISKKFLIGKAWVPDADFKQVTTTFSDCCHALQTNVESFISKIGHHMDPPTYYRVNEFTRGFQNLIDAYGTASYRELNPALYTVITFPFLFGIMFGDVGHGTIMFLFAAWMCINEKKYLTNKSDNEIWNIVFGGRYVILLMGAFSIYCGVLYNDLFGFAFTFRKSYFRNKYKYKNMKFAFVTLDPRDITGSVYVFGLDPVWTIAKNKIMIINSLKMKLSIIIGIIHMIFGVFLSLINHCYFKKFYAIFLRFIPEMLFLCCIFFWLVILIFLKWFLCSAKSNILYYGTACSPQLLIVFIDMALFTESKHVYKMCVDGYMLVGQRQFQNILMITAICMVPILLFGSPLYLMKAQIPKRNEALKQLREYKHVTNREELRKGDYDATIEALELEVKKHSESFGELMIHQGVHTIEYVLSTVSHTASYLRLWALSLAHAQLAEMLFHMVFAEMALIDTSRWGALKVFVIFALWAFFTVSILVVMEGLSAFLHTLRLHWVEFMSKFFEGSGYPFRPFSFKSILDEAGHYNTEAGCKKMLHLHDRSWLY